MALAAGQSPTGSPPEAAGGFAGVQRRVVDALCSGAALPGRPREVELVETHTSYVFLTRSRAYKLKKEVVLPFADYSTVERRRRMCDEEVRLNRRLAPSLYLGVRAIVPEGEGFRLADERDPDAVDHVVEMHRFDAADTLAAWIDRREAGPEEIDGVGRRLAGFHASRPPVLPHGDALEPLRRSADETFRTLHGLVPPDAVAAAVAGDRFTRAFLAGRAGELARRAQAGFVRDGHGDLRAEHVLLRDTVEAFDCVEFDPALRTIDVGADLAFLLMDLERLGRPDLAQGLLRAYTAHGGEPGPAEQLAFHSSQRAWVRAKVALLQGREGDARELLSLASKLAWRARGPFPLVICGLSGSGKTTLAGEVGRESGLEVLESDRVRKRLGGLEPNERASQRLYEEDFNLMTYAELGRLAREERDAGRGVLVDGTFRRHADRQAFLLALGRHADEARFVECVASPDTLAERTAARVREGAGASDATPEVVRAQRFDWLAEARGDRHAIVRTDRPPAEICDDVEAFLDARLAQLGA